MSAFLLLTGKLLPLYLLVLIGFIAGRSLKPDRESVGKLVFYVLIPGVIFRGALITPVNAGVLLLPLVTYSLCVGICLLFYRLTGLVWTDSRRNIAAFSAGIGNFGYFGLPIAMAVMGPEVEGRYIVALLGPMMYQFTAGFFITARGRHSGREALRRTLTLPALYAFLLGIALNASATPVPQAVMELTEAFRGAYSVLGMMIIGLALAAVKRLRPDWAFVGVTFGARFLAWPAAILAVILADRLTFGVFDAAAYRMFVLFGVVPLGANTAVMASMFRMHEEQMATAVLLSTVFSLGYVPLILSLTL